MIIYASAFLASLQKWDEQFDLIEQPELPGYKLFYHPSLKGKKVGSPIECTGNDNPGLSAEVMGAICRIFDISSPSDLLLPGTEKRDEWRKRQEPLKNIL